MLILQYISCCFIYKNKFQLLAISFSYFLLVNKLYELNVFKLWNVFQTCPEDEALIMLEVFKCFHYGKFNSIMYIFSFSLVFKLCKPGLQIISFRAIFFFGSVNIGSYLVVRYFERRILTLGNSGLYILPLFGHGQCSIWRFKVLAFIKSASLTTIYFF